MLRIVLARPGSTDFDAQGRIKGSLDLPMNDQGADQVSRLASALSDQPLNAIYASPCQAASETAEAIARGRDVRVKTLQGLKNLDHGLWHGKLIEEVRRGQPKLYRRGREHPETVCPPGGEAVAAARERVDEVLAKLVRKHRDATIAIVVAEPLATLVRAALDGGVIGDLWKIECDCGTWEWITVESEPIGSLQ